MRELSVLLTRQGEDAPLDVAALQLARVEHPDLDVAPFVQLLDSHAVELAGRLWDGMTGKDFVAAANEYLFQELGFRGNDRDYYNARNSCLNDVLMSRVGIPISLAVIYMEIARRLAKPVHGIALPGHFLVEYNDRKYSTYIDVFHFGRLLTVEECLNLARSSTGFDVSGDPSIFRPASKRQIVLRMLNNLRGVYFRTRQWTKAVHVLNLLIQAAPDAPDTYKQRGAVHLQLECFKAAEADFEMYLRLARTPSDRREVQEQIGRIRRLVS